MFMLGAVIDEQNGQTAEFEQELFTRRKSSSGEKVDSGVPQRIPAITTSLVLQNIEDVDETSAAAAGSTECCTPQGRTDQHNCDDVADGEPEDVRFAWMEAQNSRRESTSSSVDSSPPDDGFSPTASDAKETSGKRPALRLSAPAWDGFSFGAASGTNLYRVAIDADRMMYNRFANEICSC